MEARFIILHPDDPEEILLATTLIRCLKTQVEEAFVYSAVKEKHRWLLDSNPHLDEIFVYQSNPAELTDQLRDFLPDYLIDLDGGRDVRRFKNRLKVLDFPIKRKNIGGHWQERAFETCTLFDVQDDGLGQELVTDDSYRNLLPGDFLNGYLVLSLDSLHNRPLPDEKILQMVVMTEKPFVITGGGADRMLADRIGQSTGCAVFPTCGDLSPSETASVLRHASGAIVFDSIWSSVTAVFGVEKVVIRENMDDNQLKDMALWARSLIKHTYDRSSV